MAYPIQTSHQIIILSPSNLIKLDRHNFVLWKSQILPVLRGHDLEGYADGSLLCSPKFTAGSSSDTNLNKAEVILNSAYLAWIKQDQLLLSWILSSLTKGVLAQVGGCTTARGVWQSLEHMYALQSRAKIVQLRLQLQTTKKGAMFKK